MAIALVNTSMGTVATDPATFSFTCNAPADLLVVLYIWRTTGTAESAGPLPTYGGTNMSGQFANTQVGGMGAWCSWLYAPTTGSALTWSADMTAAATAGRWVAAAFSGADPAHVPSTGADTAGVLRSTTATPSVSLSPTSADGVTISGCAHEGAAIMTAKGANQVGLGGDADGFFDEGVWNSAFTYELNPPTGTNADVQSFTNAASDVQAMTSVWFAAAAGGGAAVIPILVTARTRS